MLVGWSVLYQMMGGKVPAEKDEVLQQSLDCCILGKLGGELKNVNHLVFFGCLLTDCAWEE